MRRLWGVSGDVESVRAIFCHYVLRHSIAKRFRDGSKQCHFCGCRVGAR